MTWEYVAWLSRYALAFVQLLGQTKLTIAKKHKFSLEWREADLKRAYARGLRRFVKRRIAVRTAQPFLVAIVAAAENFIYANGAICYTFQKAFLRILLLTGCADHEIEVNIHRLLQSVIPGYGRSLHSEFRPLHYADGIISCITRLPTLPPKSWLLVWDIHNPERVMKYLLESDNRIFVRNDNRFLYYGVRSEIGEDTFKRWSLRGLDLSTGEWTPQRIMLLDIVGAEIEATVCFEIFDGYFYGLSSQNMFEPVHDKWNSFFQAFRFRLGQHQKRQILPQSSAWRRQASEGPLDDRWSFLKLQKDEESGKIYVYETRREWPPDNSQSQRTCFRKELVFPEATSECDDDFASAPEPADWDSEAHVERRSADDVHVGDNGSSDEVYTRGNTFVHFYDPSARAFMDLVNDHDPSNLTTQRLRLRIRPRLPNAGSASKPRSGKSPPGQSCDPTGEDAAADQEVLFWPPEQDPERPDPSLNTLYKILTPDIDLADAEWAGDERFLVYSPRGSGSDRLRAVVLISFDPGLRFPGLRKFRGQPSKQYQGGTVPSSRSSCCSGDEGASSTVSPSLVDGDAMQVLTNSLHKCEENTSEVPAVTSAKSKTKWSAKKQPFYQLILNRGGALGGFDFTK